MYWGGKFYYPFFHMAKYIGRRISVGFGKETVRGTAVAVWLWQPKTDLSFDEKFEVIHDESSVGSIIDTRASHIVKRRAEWEIAWNVDVNAFGYLLLSLMGSVSSGVATGSAYSHAFTVNETNQTQSLSIGIDDAVGGDFKFSNAVIESLTLNAEVGKFATFTVTFKGKKGASESQTATFPLDYTLLAKHAIFKTATNLAGLAAASAIVIKSFEITMTKNLEDDFSLGSVDVTDFVNKQFSIEGSFTAMFEATTFKDLALAGTQKAVRFQLIDTATTIWSSSNPTLTIDLPLATFTQWSKSQANNEVVMETLKFKSVRSRADASALNITLVNTATSY